MRELLRSTLIRVWVPVLAAAAVAAAVDPNADAGDLVYFVHSGERLLSAAWPGTFSDPTLQSGPLQLVVTGAVRSTTALAFIVELGVVALLLAVLARLGVATRWRLVVGLAAVVAGLTHGAFVEGHPAEAISPLLWVLAALDARRGRPARAGLLLGLSAGLELWGVLGAPVLLLSPRPRDAVKGLAVEIAVVAAMLAPFALLGEFRMFAYEWRVAEGSAQSLVLPVGTHFGWPLRLLQAALACGLGSAVAWRMRSKTAAVCLVPLVVVLARIALDPLSYGWYWLEAEALALVGAALTVPALRALARRPRPGAELPHPAAPPPPARS